MQRFALPEAVDPSVLLAALIGHERFGNDYATRPGGDPLRHGPYWRDRITPACYDLIDASAPDGLLRMWGQRFAPLPDELRPW